MEGGDLSRGFLTTHRVWLLVNIAITVALVPALFTATEHHKGALDVTTGATLETLPVVATAAPGSDAVVVLGPSQTAADAGSTTTTTAAAPPTTISRRVVVSKPAPPKAVAPKPTTTTTKPRPAAPKPAPAPPTAGRSESGKASWYDHDPGICAHKSLPFGTVVTVTDVDNGRSVQCTVGDRGPFVDGWIIDLNPREFNQLAPQSTGVLNVRITW